MPVYASEDTSYVGYYADLDGNTSNGPEGIIYADLAVGSKLALGPENEQAGDRKWNNDSYSVYQYDAVKDGLKKYTVGSEEVTGFGTTWSKPMITETTGGGTTKRFYVMALDDLDDSEGKKYHYWWQGGNGKLDPSKVVPNTENDFSKDSESTGKKNTDDWIKNYDSESYRTEYGIEESTGSYTDLWKMDTLRAKVSEGWFVPSKSEWSAFGDMCYKLMNMTNSSSSYNQTFGLSYYYWSSSQGSANGAYYADFGRGYIYNYYVGGNGYVRLSTTF